MSTNCFSGVVFDKVTLAGVDDFRVDAMDLRGVISGPVASASTDKFGRFKVTLSDEQIAQLFGDVAPVLYFVVSKSADNYASTEKTNRWNAKRTTSGRIEINTTRPIGPAATVFYTVDGLVADLESGPVASTTVKIYRRTLASGTVVESLLTSTTTSSNGRFKVSFAPGVANPDLVVRAEAVTPAAEATICKAQPRSSVELVVKGTTNARYPGRTRYTKTLEAMNAHVSGFGLNTLTAAQIAFISCQTGVANDEVQALVDGAKLNASHSTIATEVFFGLLRKGVGATSDDVFGHRLPVLQRLLEDAALERIISPGIVNATNLPTLMTALQTAARAQLRVTTSGKLRLGALIDGAPATAPSTITATERDKFLNHALANEGSADSFWSTVQGDGTIGSHAKARFRFAVEMGALTLSFLPMATALHARVAAGTLTDDPKLLTKYEASDWDTLISSTGSPSGMTATEYRNAIKKSVESRFRTARIRHVVGQEAASSALRKFLEAGVNASFDFAVHRVGRYLIETPTALSSLTAPEQADAKKRLRDIERLFRITSSYADTQALIAAGVTSSYAVHQMGRDSFVAAFTASIGASEAGAVFDKACWRSSAAQVMRMKYSSQLENSRLPVFNRGESLATGSLPTPIGDWETLFGAVEQCACTHCRSVLGPGAYVADVLELLERVPKTPSGNGKAEVLARRPDLQHLALSCENADTPLPYVDVVNEIMEVRLAASSWPSWPSSPNPIQTYATAEQLASQPEVLYPTQHIAAYTALEASVHPFNLPFHVWQEEARVYLDHLGVSRAELLRALPGAGGVDARDLALERLRITGRQYDIIASPTLTPQAYWGLASWPSPVLAKTLMEKAGLDFDGLRELLTTEYAVTNSIELPAEGTCDLSTLSVDGIGSALADPQKQMLHRLLRLRLALGVSISDADRARQAVGTLSATSLNRLAGMLELSKRLERPLVEVLAWYGRMDRWGKWDPSLFERVFLDKRVLAPGLAVFETILASGTSSSEVADALPALAAALRLNDDELRLLTDPVTSGSEMGLAPIVPASGDLDIDSLSRLFRMTSFARASLKSLSDFIVLREFSGIGVLEGDDISATPDGTVAFLDMLPRFERTGLTVPEAQYIFRHFATPESGLEPTVEQEDAWEAEILDEISKASAEAISVKDVSGATARSLVMVLDPSYTDGPAHLDGLVVNPGGTAVQSAAFIAAMAPFLGDAADATDKLLTAGGTIKEREERYAYLARRFTRYANAAGAMKSWVSRTLDLGTATSAILLENGHLVWGAEPAIRAFLPKTHAVDTFGDPPGSPEERRGIIKRLHKVAILVNRLRLTALDLEKLYPNGGADPGGLPFLDLQELRMEAPAAPPSSPSHFGSERAAFATVLRIADLAWLRDRYVAGPEAMYKTFELGASATAAEMYDRLALEMRFASKDIEVLANHFGVATAASFRNEQAPYRVARAMEILRRLGASATQAVGWLDVEAALPTDFSEVPTNALGIARDIKKLARAKHDGVAWATVAKPLRDPLRERQRQALVAALLPKVGVTRSDELFEKLLVDVDMSPCAVTSRIVAAHGSLQTFTNRILLNLETGLAPNKQLAEEWEWMHAYRLWEANRKVFLWPENWIEPELRDDKTPLFEDLETALLQGEITDKTAEAAYRGYLDGLADVANLEIVAVHTEKRAASAMTYGQAAVLAHVIGRTKKPHRYFHRMRTTEGWSPWRKMDVDIQGDHIIPVTLGGRLYLFWGILEEKERSVPIPQLDPPEPAEDPADNNFPDLEGEQFDTVNKLNEKAYDLLLEQKAQKDAELAAAKPPPLALYVRLAVAELNDGVWSSSASMTDDVELGASPWMPGLSFTATANGATITLKMLTFTPDGFREAARFRFDAGSTRFDGRVSTTIEPANGYPYGSGVIVQPAAGNADGGEQFITKAGLVVDKQNFSTTSKLNAYLIENGDILPQARVLNSVSVGTRVVASRGQEPVGMRNHLVVQDNLRSFFLRLSSRPYKVVTTAVGPKIALSGSLPEGFLDRDYRFELFSHPFVNDFRSRLVVHGLNGLLKPSAQKTPLAQYQENDITATYSPQYENVEVPFPKEVVDFKYGSAYGVYNWEIFFHAPLLIATRLMQEGRFAEARKWFHTIFDPTDGTPPPGGSANLASRYWKFKPFADNLDLASIQTALGDELLAWANNENQTPAVEALITQIAKWRRDPFDPHAIAQLRIIAYQKAVVQKYVENLIAWGDQLFAQDSIESINEATQLYLLASQIMGTKPTIIPSPNPGPIQSYKQLDDPPLGSFDAFANALVETESIVPHEPVDGFECRGGRMPPATITGSPYFCVPHNEKLFGFWDILADRLFKIRHCQNIEGIVRALPLYQPPIDPGLLVRAKAAGLDLNSVLNDLSVSAPPYRYAILAARALEYTGAVSSLGSALLSALEKKDAETLSQLRASHEVANQESMRAIRRNQVNEAKENLEAAKRSRRSAEERLDYYESREFMSPGEAAAMALGHVADGLSVTAQTLKTAGSQASNAPDAVTGGAGMAGTPVATLKYGGDNVSRAAFGAGDALEIAARATNNAGSVMSTVASYKRRMDDWQHQAKLAKLEIAQIEKQIVAAEIRLAVAQQEQRLLEQQLTQSKDVERFLRTRFTNKDLYGWMVGQLSAVYYQSYKLAYEMARRAEKAYNFERAESQSFIKFGHWEGLRKGLLAGERLALDLRRMDSAYHSQNKREYELTKTVSLAELDPDAFMQIREGTANGSFTLPESRFDDDFPTHYLRRIKSANVSVHCTPGPYQSVNGRLTLLGGETRLTATAGRTAMSGVVSATATSMAQNDAGVFELNFRDDRYLPFEGAGAHLETTSGPQWRFELMGGNEFPYDSISDVVMQLRYTAREGRSSTAFTSPRKTMWRVPHAFADPFQAYLEGSATTIELLLPPGRFAQPRMHTLQKIIGMRVYIRGAVSSGWKLTPPGGSAITLSGGTAIGNYTAFDSGVHDITASTTVPWKLEPPTSPGIVDVWVSATYSLNS